MLLQTEEVAGLPTAVSQQSVVKSQHGVTDLIGNSTLFILSAVLEVHEHVDLKLKNEKQNDLIPGLINGGDS